MSNATELVFDFAASYADPGSKLLPSEWVQKYGYVTEGDKVGPFSFENGRQYQIEILDTLFGPFKVGENHRTGCVFKGSQAGITLLHQLGMLYLNIEQDESVFHLLPRESDRDDKAKKVGEIISHSPYLESKYVRSKSHKRRTITDKTYTTCSSNSQKELKSWQAQSGFCDEDDELTRVPFDSVEMVKKRMGSYERTRLMRIGTPTLPDFGIDLVWKSSDQRYYHVPCGYCGEFQVLEFERNISWDRDLDDNIENVAATAYFHCSHCGKKWDREMRKGANSKGVWIASKPENKVIGFNVSRLYVCSSAAPVIVEGYLKGLVSDYAMKEHVNQDLAKPYLPKGGKLEESMIRQRIDLNLKWGSLPKGWDYVTCGIDVQGALEPFEFVYEIQAYIGTHAFVVQYGRTKDIGELEGLLGTDLKKGKFDCALALIDTTDGKHKEIVEHLCSRIPCMRPASFAHRQDPFRREKIEKVKSGSQRGRAYAINVNDALTEHTGCFRDLERRPACITIASNPKKSKESAFVKEYTGIVRVDKVYPDGGVKTIWIKTRETGVDAPYAGCLATYAGRRASINRSRSTTKDFGFSSKTKRKPREIGQVQSSQTESTADDWGYDLTGHFT